MKKSIRKITHNVAIILIVLILVFSCNFSLYANGDIIIPSNVVSPMISSDDFSNPSNQIAPLSISYTTRTWCYLSQQATVYYAPYGSGCASTGYTLGVGTGVYVLGREYDYFYIYWFIGQKEMYGYVPISSINLTDYTWIQYDIYRPGICKATIPVLSFAGTTNTYFQVGEIYANEHPLLILGQYRNQYNNKVYFYVQYHDGNNLAKRGWVEYIQSNIYVNALQTDSLFNSTGPYRFINCSTGKALGWNPSTNNIEQQEINGSLYQYFTFEPVATYPYNGYGYVRILSLANPSMAMTVSGKGYAEGLSIIMQPKADIDKKQEFMVSISFLTNNLAYSKIATRSTGNYRVLGVYGGSTAAGADIIQSKLVSNTSLYWSIEKVSSSWSEIYRKSDGTAKNLPNLKILYDSSLTGKISLSEVQECVDHWNDVYSLSITVVTSIAENSPLRMATIVDEPLTGTTIGRCNPQLLNGSTVTTYLGEAGELHVNDPWFGVWIQLDITDLGDKDTIKRILTHELGHALKQSHTFQRLFYESSDEYWGVVSEPVSIMTGNVNYTGTDRPVAIDVYRLKQKWDGIL